MQYINNLEFIDPCASFLLNTVDKSRSSTAKLSSGIDFKLLHAYWWNILNHAN